MAGLTTGSLIIFAACSDHVDNAKNVPQPKESTGNAGSLSSRGVPISSYEIINTWPHDPAAYTQGLEFYQGALYESTGLNGSSSLRKVDLETGKVLQQRNLPSEYFGEGITVLHGKIYQLTWKNEKGFIYEVNTFQPVGKFSYTGEGWGLTHNPQSLIMSDGTNEIRFLDPQTFKTTRTISVFSDQRPLMNLNELEYIHGEIFANVYETNYLVRIDPASGKVLGWIDLTGLLSPEDRRRQVDVLNGIAYDEKNDRLVVTGKWWPKLFQIRLKGNNLRADGTWFHCAG